VHINAHQQPWHPIMPQHSTVLPEDHGRPWTYTLHSCKARERCPAAQMHLMPAHHHIDVKPYCQPKGGTSHHQQRCEPAAPSFTPGSMARLHQQQLSQSALRVSASSCSGALLMPVGAARTSPLLPVVLLPPSPLHPGAASIQAAQQTTPAAAASKQQYAL